MPLTWYQPNSKDGFGSRFSATRVVVGVDVTAITVAVKLIVVVGWGDSVGVAEAVKVGKGVLVGTGVKVGASVALAAGVADLAGGGAVQVGGTVAGPVVAFAGELITFAGDGVSVDSAAASVGIGDLSPLEPKPWQPAANNKQIRNSPARLFMIRPLPGYLFVPGPRLLAWSLPDRGIRS